MNEFTKKKYFIGIDISKEHLDLAILSASAPDVFVDKKVANSFSGFSKIQSWLAKENIIPR